MQEILFSFYAGAFPSLLDALILCYSVPAAIALFSFKRQAGARVALRTVPDAAVVVGSVLVISWHTALCPAFSSDSDGSPY